MVAGILKRLERAGVRLEVRDGDLYTIGPSNAINHALATTIRVNKKALVRHLQADVDDTPDGTITCSDCGIVDIIAAYDPKLRPLCYECARGTMPAEVFKPRERRL